MRVDDEETKGTMKMGGDEEKPASIDLSKPWTPHLKTGADEIVVCRSGITVPDHLYLSDEEREILLILEQRLRESIPRERKDNTSATP